MSVFISTCHTKAHKQNTPSSLEVGLHSPHSAKVTVSHTKSINSFHLLSNVFNIYMESQYFILSALLSLHQQLCLLKPFISWMKQRSLIFTALQLCILQPIFCCIIKYWGCFQIVRIGIQFLRMFPMSLGHIHTSTFLLTTYIRS